MTLINVARIDGMENVTGRNMISPDQTYENFRRLSRKYGINEPIIKWAIDPVSVWTIGTDWDERFEKATGKQVPFNLRGGT